MARPSTRLEVYEALSAREGSFVSGEALSDKLGLSRTAIWKAIASLRESGHLVESVVGRGYRLVSSCSDLTHESVIVNLGRAFLGGPGLGMPEPVFYEEVASTNDVAKDLARGGCAHGTVVVADAQTAGRGRLARQWFSPKGMGLWMSIVIRPTRLPLVDAPNITGMAAVAVVDAIYTLTGASAQVKWPNDIYLSGRKVCGILTEVGAEVDSVSWAVVGVGLNVNMAAKGFPNELCATATSLLIETGQRWDRSQILSAIAAAIFSGCVALERGGWPTIRGELERLSCVIGHEVQLRAPDGRIRTGKAIALDESGALLVDVGTESLLKVSSGDISLRLSNSGPDHSSVDNPAHRG